MNMNRSEAEEWAARWEAVNEAELAELRATPVAARGRGRGAEGAGRR